MTKSGHFLFESNLKWTEGFKGILTSRTIIEKIKVATPRAFQGNQGGMWSPEHLFISSLSSCFMTTYLFYAKRKGLPIAEFSCDAIGQVELKKGKLFFSAIHLYPKTGIEKQDWTEMAKEVAELSKQNCLISSALNVDIFYHPTIEIIQNHLSPKQLNKKREGSS